MITKASATKQIYDIVVAAVNVRKQNGVTQDDSLQMLLNEGDDHAMIVGVNFIAILRLPFPCPFQFHSVLLPIHCTFARHSPQRDSFTFPFTGSCHDS